MTKNWRFEHSYLQLPCEFYSTIDLQPVGKPELVVINQQLANSLGLELSDAEREHWAKVFSGSLIPTGAKPTALAYAGHQFGHFTLLGDGRAMWYGEHMTPRGERFDIQLKGSGPTPYARRGDGRAILGPMLREYLVSEAMHAFGIPTTRSLAVTLTGEKVYRGSLQPGAVLTRVAASHIRVGTFEYAARVSPLALKHLLDYTVQRHVPASFMEYGPALGLLEFVKQSQVFLICEWMRIGFIHGVMNTDNMAISGETIDYGPCTFMDEYHPMRVFSSIDTQGRYAFANQPLIAQWNFARLAECLVPLLHTDEKEAILIAEKQVTAFFELFNKQWLNMMRAKLGLMNEESDDETMVYDLLSIMQKHSLDYTNTFRNLSNQQSMDIPQPDLREWYEGWQARRGRQSLSLQDSSALMDSKNPVLIPRNHQVEKGLNLATEEGDLSWFKRCLKAYQHPYIVDPQFEDLTQPPTMQEKVHETFCGT